MTTDHSDDDEDFDEFGSGVRSRPVDLIDLPKGLSDSSAVSELQFKVSWYSVAVWGVAIFAGLWDAFMAVWYTIAIMQGEWMMALFGLLHLSVGIGLTYGAALYFLNSSRVRVDAFTIDVRHGPLPYSRPTSIPAGEIQQLFVAKTHRGTTYDLYALLNSGSTEKILSVSTIEQGHYLEQRIEAFLNITDRPVKGEA